MIFATKAGIAVVAYLLLKPVKVSGSTQAPNSINAQLNPIKVGGGTVTPVRDGRGENASATTAAAPGFGRAALGIVGGIASLVSPVLGLAVRSITTIAEHISSTPDDSVESARQVAQEGFRAAEISAFNDATVTEQASLSVSSSEAPSEAPSAIGTVDSVDSVDSTASAQDSSSPSADATSSSSSADAAGSSSADTGDSTGSI